MAKLNVAQFATELGLPVALLLEQLHAAGVIKQQDSDSISEADKAQLLTHLRLAHGADKPTKKITLARRETSEIKKADSSGRARTIQVEVRKRRVVASPATVETPVLAEASVKIKSGQVLDDQEMAAREEEARRQAELIKLQSAEQKVKKSRSKSKTATAAEAEELKVDSSQAVTLTNQAALVEPSRDGLVVGAPVVRRTVKSPEKIAPVAAPAVPVVDKEGTLHKPLAKPGEKIERVNKTAKPGKRSVKREEQGLHKRPAQLDSKLGNRSGAWATPVRGKRHDKHSKQASPVAAGESFTLPTEAVVYEVAVPETITVAELAQKMSVKASEVIKSLMKLGSMVTINQVLDQETAMIVVEEMGHIAKAAKLDDPDVYLTDTEESHDMPLESRAPVVTVMGHVDHGKTSLLDYIRRARVASGEAGGITQHIGAYHVDTPRGMITFLDTPGHEAFTAMRARGAKATDIVILVVAADDGVMPQTIEAVHHARTAKVPLVVAVTKVDKPEADPDRVRTELAKQEVIPEDWGGQNMFVSVSAGTGAGVDKLLEAILLQAEVLELRAPRNGLASGVVIESSVEKGRGAVATVLVKKGTLRMGDPIIAGSEYGRVRAMFDETGKPVQEAPPSMPVVVLGLSSAPNAGDELLAVESERKAREVALYRQGKFRDVKLARHSTRAEDAFSQMGEDKAGLVSVLIKADVQGSAEALRDALAKLSTEEVQVKVISSGLGGITESDVQLAAASKALVIGFNVRADAGARDAVKETGVEVRYYSIIYEAIDDVKQMMSGMLQPEVKEQIVGVAQVREVFRSSKFGVVAGCLVTEGLVKRNNPIRVLRDNVVIFEGALESLRRFKDDVAEVRAGTECGIGVKNYQDVRVGDQIECFARVEVARTLQ